MELKEPDLLSSKGTCSGDLVRFKLVRESERLISRPLLGAGVPESKDKSLTGGGSIGSLEELPFVGQDFPPPFDE